MNLSQYCVYRMLDIKEKMVNNIDVIVIMVQEEKHKMIIFQIINHIQLVVLQEMDMKIIVIIMLHIFLDVLIKHLGNILYILLCPIMIHLHSHPVKLKEEQEVIILGNVVIQHLLHIVLIITEIVKIRGVNFILLFSYPCLLLFCFYC